MNESDSIGLTQLLRGAAQLVPDMVTVNRGVLTLATARGERRKSIGSILERQARRHAGRPALRYGKRSWTYAEFNAWANQFAHLLIDQGVGHGDTVAVMIENRPEALAAVAGIVKLGAVAGMINTNQRGEVLAHSLGLIDPRVILVGDECADALAEVRAGLSADPSVFWLADGDASSCPQGVEDAAPRLDQAARENPRQTATVRMQDGCFYIFTSGTTGLPKASVMTHARWVRALGGIGLASLRLKASDVFFCALPLYHNNALTLSWGATLGSGACLALTRKFSASRFWDQVREADATCFCYIGELCRYLLNQPPSPRDRSHRVRVCIGNGLRPEIWDEFKTRFGIARINEFYGASEGNLVFTNTFGIDRSAGFCPLSYAVVEYEEEDGSPRRGSDGRLRKVGRGDKGLLITEVTERAPFDGYTDAAASEKKLIRDAFADGDLWFNTGDLVRDQGFKHIAFVDRLGDTFRWKGENVATTEVESALNRCPQVEEAAVYGVEVPGADGRAGMAALTLADPAAGLDGEALHRQLSAQLPAYAMPVLLRLRSAHETTATFKLRKVELKDTAWRCEDPVYLLHEGRYQPLDAGLRRQLEDGALRL